MRYDVTYQVAGDERVDQVEAADAATAAAMVQAGHAREEGMFELMSVTLLEDSSAEDAATVEGDPERASQNPTTV